MKEIWGKFTSWLASKGGALHVLVLVYIAGLTWFSTSSAFHTLVLSLWAKFPSLLQTAVFAVMQILAIYGVGTAAKVTTQKVFAKFYSKGTK